MKIDVEYLPEAQRFIEKMPDKARWKMLYNIGMVRIGVKDTRIENTDIWEFRAEYQSNEYRLLSFWDKNKSSLVIATHGFNKKTQKTPKSEIEHAKQIKNDYFKTK